MNIWNEPYPKKIDDLIDKSIQYKELLFKKLNNEKCKTLLELYPKNQKGLISKDMALFNNLGYLPNTFSNSKFKKEAEIKGLYIFGELDKKSDQVIPRYVGISRTIFRRLKQHGWGKKHNEATLAALKAITKGSHRGVRNTMSEETIEEQQKIIRNYKVVILPETNDYDMYFMEVYLAGVLKTEWNSFRTH